MKKILFHVVEGKLSKTYTSIFEHRLENLFNCDMFVFHHPNNTIQARIILLLPPDNEAIKTIWTGIIQECEVESAITKKLDEVFDEIMSMKDIDDMVKFSDKISEKSKAELKANIERTQGIDRW